MSVERDAVLSYVSEKYGTSPEYLWVKTPDAAVLRNPHNKKWYGLVMNVRKAVLGFESEDCTDILNVKCSPVIREILIGEGKAIPAYHMNKKLWISVLLDSDINMTKICGVIDESYKLVDK